VRMGPQLHVGTHSDSSRVQKTSVMPAVRLSTIISSSKTGHKDPRIRGSKCFPLEIEIGTEIGIRTEVSLFDLSGLFWARGLALVKLRNLLGFLSQNYEPNGWHRRTSECLALGTRSFFIDQTDCVAVRGGACIFIRQ